jgi:hypothetical protein
MKSLKFALSSFLIASLCSGLGIGLVGCASINSVSLTSIPATRTNVVRSEAKRMVFLGFNFNNDFIDTMTDDLKSQCPNGQVRGLLTKDETVMYFLFFLYEYRVSATGYCVKKPAVALMDGTTL